MKELFLNDRKRWQFGDVELTSGDVVEVEAFEHWLCGRIESSDGRYFVLDPDTGATLRLCEGIKARLPAKAGR